MPFYAGIGSRQTPLLIMETMTNIATLLESRGYTLRSGGADGADYAFAVGCKNKEIYLPWKGFNRIKEGIVGASDEAFKLAESIHPAWSKCSGGAKKLHARNIHQILGKDIHDKELYSDFVVCWTPGGKEVGGTATAIKLAKQNDIDVYNLGIAGESDRLIKFLNNVKE